MPFMEAGVQRSFSVGLVSGNTYLGLHDANGGVPTAGNEVSGSGYARLVRALSDWTLSGVECRAELADFAAPSADWGTPDTMALWTAENGGTLILHFPLNPELAQAIASGDSVGFLNNDFNFEITI